MVLESHCGIYMDVSVYYLYVCKHHASTFQVQKLHVCMSHSNSEELTIVLCIAKKPAHPSMMVLVCISSRTRGYIASSVCSMFGST